MGSSKCYPDVEKGRFSSSLLLLHPPAYLTALLRLLSEAEQAGLVGPGDLEVVEEEVDDEEEDDQEPAEDFQRPLPPDYDETGRGLSVARPWWGRAEPQLSPALLDR